MPLEGSTDDADKAVQSFRGLFGSLFRKEVAGVDILEHYRSRLPEALRNGLPSQLNLVG
jgi:hypothetical protein